MPIQPSDSNYIFEKDINFQPLNLYDFFWKGCNCKFIFRMFYYGELGFEPNKITIFDYVFDFIFDYGFILFFFLSFYLIRNLTLLIKLAFTK